VQLTLLITGGLEMLLGMQLDPVEVIVIERQAAQRRVHCGSQLFERGLVEAAKGGATVAVGTRLATGVADDAAVRVAHSEDQHLQGTAVELFVQAAELRGVGTIGDQQQGARGFLGGQ
jgi:hypothetical protein